MHTALAAFVTRRRFVAGFAAPVAVLALFTGLAAPAFAADTAMAGTGGPTRTVRVTGHGFAPNENVSLWITAPDRTVTPLDTAQADGSGALAASVVVGGDGTWLVTARGLTSKHEIVTRYIWGADGTESPDKSVAAGTISTTPAATLGQDVTVTGEGMGYNETMSLWLTSPSGAVSPLASQQAGRDGKFSVQVSFATQGFRQVTAKGRDSGREVVRGFNVGDVAPTATAAPVLVTPAAAIAVSTTPAAQAAQSAPTAAASPTPNPATVASTPQP